MNQDDRSTPPQGGGGGDKQATAATSFYTLQDCERLEFDNLNEIKAAYSISSAKPANGVEQLRDGNINTYWQSDGHAPHTVNIQFLKKSAVTKLCFFVNYTIDESYTPKKVQIKAGNTSHDLFDVFPSIELEGPVGWVIIDLHQIDPENPEGDNRIALETHFLQLRFLTMHQGGRDTHIRQLKVFGPRSPTMVMGNTAISNFHTVEMSQFASLR